MISDEDKKWILKTLRKHYDTKDVGWEYELMEYGIQKNKPSNIRAYVERELKRKEYERRLGVIETDIRHNMKPFDDKEGKKIRKRYEALVKEIKKDDPEFWEDNKRRFKHAMFLLGTQLAGQIDRIEE